MKILLFTTLFLFTALQQFAIGQEGANKHYYVDTAKDIKNVYFDEIKDSIALTENKESIAAFGGLSGAIMGIVIGELVPILVEKVGLLAYNPKNYISEYGTGYLFEFNALQNASAIDKLIYTRMGVSNNSKHIISTFKFDLKPISESDADNLQAYTALALEEYQSNYTQVKLKNNGKKTNIVAAVTMVYFDQQDKKQELNLQPYKLSGIIPEGSNGQIILIDEEKRNYQIIPPMKFIESITVKITDVNDRKKDWDKYLELFNGQKGNISGFLIDQIR